MGVAQSWHSWDPDALLAQAAWPAALIKFMPLLADFSSSRLCQLCLVELNYTFFLWLHVD